MAVQDNEEILDWVSEPFGSDFHGFVGTPEYENYLSDYLDSLDEDPSYDGILGDESAEHGEILSKLCSEVSGTGVAVLSGPVEHSAIVVFNKRQDDGRYIALRVSDDGEWDQFSMTASEIADAACDVREKLYNSAWFSRLIEEMERAGFPVSAGSDMPRISHFATFVDRLPEYRELMEEGPYPVLLKERDLTAQDFEEVISSRARPDGRKHSYERKLFSPAKKACYYFRMAEKETVDFVRDRYAEKAEYWKKVAENAVISPEMEASCGPDHKWNAVDNYINVRHKLEKNRDSAKNVELELRLKYWENAARDEKKVNDLVRMIEHDDGFTGHILGDDRDLD